MSKLFHIVCLCIGIILTFSSIAQTKDTIAPVYVDTIHKPKVATIISAVFPGGGQIYNQLYKIEGQKNNLWWKLPIIYGGLGGVGYLTVFNHQQFRTFKDERLSRLDLSYTPGIYPSLTSDQLKVYQDQYERWRNLSIIGGIGVYALQLLDANVEGHLMHFDASDDLTITWAPGVLFSGSCTANYGVSLRISFK